MPVILIDTNVLVTFTDADDQHHERCKAWLSRTGDRLLLPATVLAEAC
ncbi:MAG: PIN domain-containing protein [Mycobacteriales bacterium]